MANLSLYGVVCVLVTVLISNTHSSKILFLLPLATKSHKNMFDPLIRALSDRGHNLTVVAPMKIKTPLSNVREIVPVPFSEINAALTSGNPFDNRKEGKFVSLLNWNSTFVEVTCNKFYLNEDIKRLIKEESGSFDVIIINFYLNGCAVGMVHALKAPHIYVVTMPGMNVLVQKTGLFFPPSFVPNVFVPYSHRMSFKERVINFLIENFMIIFDRLSFNSYYSKMYQKHLGADVPSINEIDQNVSMIMMNSHFSMTYPRPILPDVLEVGGLHTGPAKPLPKDFDEFVSGASEGFILFSLGSIVQARDMPTDMKEKFINVFSRLKQRVVWKWEGGVPENLPKNILMSRWLPQQDLLGHPNIKLFITHGGLLSTQEAVYHGTPLIGFPLFADQDLNMMNAQKAGFAVTLEILDFTEEQLERTINQILTDKNISERAKTLSAIFRDQPHRPIETAVYGVEYVIRHKGAPQLRSAGRELNFIAYHSIDVISFLLALLFFAVWITWKLVLTLWRLCVWSKETSQIKTSYEKTYKNKRI